MILSFALVFLTFTGCETGNGDGGSLGMQPGTYQVSAQGIDNEYYFVWVSVDEYSIVEITWEEKPVANTPHTGGAALPVLRERVLQYQTAEVDGIAGATLTVNGFKEAVKEALVLARAPESFTQAPTYTTRDQTIEADVLIWGSGIAGLSAAVAAKTEKSAAEVYLIEKLPIIGGSTKYSAGVVYGALDNTEPEAKNLADYYYQRAQGFADYTLIKKFADESYETLEFLDIDPAGISMPSGTAEAPRMRMSPGGNGLVQFLYKKATDLKVKILTGVEGTDLILTNGAVTGAKAKSNTVNYTFNVKNGVIIATGGFDSDRELLSLHNSDSMYDFAESSHANVGQGIKIAERDANAATVFKGGKIGWVAVDPVKFHESMLYYSQVVDQDGKLLNYDPPPAAPAGKNNAGKDHPILAAGFYETHNDDYAVVHRRMLDARKAGATGFWGISNAAPETAAWQYAGLAYSVSVVPNVKTAAQAIAELAGLTGMDAAELKASFASGREVSSMFGSGSPLTDAETMTVPPLPWDPPGTLPSEAPTIFTATRAVPSSIGSMGGIKINPDAQALTGDGQPIPGLYAAGECANGDLFYLEYPASGTSLAVSATFGRIAGEKAVNN
jgi:fumarate reductase flavoprotein subunit